MVDRRKPVVRELTRIGEGRTAEIFAWGDGRALRLFREGTSREWVRHEMEVYRSVHRAGLDSPDVHPAESDDGLVEIGGRFGFVMDRVDGPSMLELMIAKPWRLWRTARGFARLHLAMHASTVQGLPSQRDRFHGVLDRISGAIGSGVADRIRATIERLWTADAVCHGDFHPDNVLMSDRGPVVIDWGPATFGCRAADVARTAYLLRCATPPPGTRPIEWLITALFRRLFLVAYRRAYLRGSTVVWSDVIRWGPVIAALRLAEGIPEERDLLLRDIRKHFGDSTGR
jgi:Ser/Thr protein kinase RdoA (MazF antagonist)